MGRSNDHFQKNDLLRQDESKIQMIHEEELVKALKDGRLAGAGLDKYENEPKADPELVKLKNVVLTPHSDGALLEERNRIYLSVVRQVLEWEERNR